MHVLVDATMLDGGPSGAATRLSALDEALARRGRVRVSYLVRPGVPLFGERPLAAAQTVSAPGLSRPLSRALSGPALVARARALAADVLHCGAFPLPRPGALPLVVTLHDLRYLHAGPELPWLRRTWARRFLPAQLARARRVVCVSDWTARGLEQSGAVPAARIAVVPNAATPGLLRVEDPARLAAFRRRLGLNARFALAIGPLARHKRIGLLLEALVAARARPGGEDLALVLAGRADRAALAALQRRALALGLADVVRVTSVLPLPELSVALSAADALLLASAVEGFSIPAVDAQHLSVPVVAVAAGALPEVAGADAAWLVAPHARRDALAAELGEALVEAVTPGAERDARVQRGRERAARWSWDESAAKLEQVWEAAGE